MIPKIIHLCWLSGDPFPNDIQQCIDSWKMYLPDYEIWLWDTKKFDVSSTEWTKQAFEAKKYAFAADYIRLYALYNYGGIYLDSDVMVYKSFDDLLKLPYFIGQDYTGAMEAAVIGSEKGMPWIAEILERYKGRSFIKDDGSYDMEALPIVFYNQLIDKYRFKCIHKNETYTWGGDTFVLFDRDFFNSRNSIGSRRTKKSYCSHNYMGAWTTKQNDFITRVKRFLPIWVVKMVYDFSHATYKKAFVHRHDPLYQQNRKHHSFR